MVQRLGLGNFTAKGVSSISGRGTNISQAAQCGKIKNQVKLQFAERQSCDFCWEVGGRIDPPGNPLSSASQLPTLSSSILISVAWQVVRPDLTLFFLSQTGDNAKCQGQPWKKKRVFLINPELRNSPTHSMLWLTKNILVFIFCCCFNTTNLVA